MAYSIIKYVDLSTSDSGNGNAGTPWTFDEFRENISAVDVDTTFRLKGSVATSADVIMSATVNNTNVDITNWEGVSDVTGQVTEPWYIHVLGSTSFQWSAPTGGSSLSNCYFRNGRMLIEDIGGDPRFYTPTSEDKIRFAFDNMHLTFSGDCDFFQIAVNSFQHCNICGLGTNHILFHTGLSVWSYVNFAKSIFYIEPNFKFWYAMNITPTDPETLSFSYRDCVFNLSGSDVSANDGGLYENQIAIKPASVYNTNEMIYEWNPDPILSSTDLSAITSADINYVSDTFKDIRIPEGTISIWWSSLISEIYDGTRDGVGALYYPELNPVLSASLSSGEVPLSVDFSTILSGDAVSASGFLYDFGDGNTSAITSANTVVSHTYTSIETFAPTVCANSWNGYYDVSDSLNYSIVVSASILSGAIITVDPITSAMSIMAYTNNPIAISSTSLSGDPIEYDVDWDDGNTDTNQPISNNQIYKEHTYTAAGTYNISATLENNALQYATIQTQVLIFDISKRILFVNINREYDTTATNEGTLINPLDYGEFVAMTTSGGTATKFDTFRLMGFREISASNENINCDYTKGLTIDAWDLSAYGPWMIVKNNQYDSDTMSFVGANIIGGLYYNKPDYYGGEYYGSPLNISSAKNMYIVNQGYGLSINSNIYETYSIETSSSSAYECGLMASDIYDNFETSALNPWWSVSFHQSATFSAYNDDEYAILSNVNDYLSATPYSISGDNIDFRWSWFIETAGADNSVKFRIQEPCTSSFTEMSWVDNEISFLKTGLIEIDKTSYTPPENSYIHCRLLKDNNEVSGFWMSASDDISPEPVSAWNTFSASNTLSSCNSIDIMIEGATNHGFGYISVSALSAYSSATGLINNEIIPCSGTYINDNFDNGYNLWWSSEFKTWPLIELPPGSGDYAAVAGDDTTKKVTLDGYVLSGDFVFEFGNRQGLTQGTYIGLHFMGCDTSLTTQFEIDVNYHFNTIEWQDGTGSETNYLNQISADSMFYPYAEIRTKIERFDGVIRSYYMLNGGWSPIGTSATPNVPINYDEDVIIYVNGTTKNGYSYFKLWADSGFPYIVNTTEYTVSSIGDINIIGSTIYTSEGFNVGRSYETSSLSSMSADFNIEDSVITRLYSSNSTSAVSLYMRNSTFDKSYAEISADFEVSANTSNQFSWTPPTNYPFLRTAGSSYGYNQNLEWLITNPQIIAPFDGITSPPNPGLNFSAYPGYPTGLLGYDRATYERDE